MVSVCSVEAVCGVHLLQLLLVFQPPQRTAKLLEVQLSVKNSEEGPLQPLYVFFTVFPKLPKRVWAEGWRVGVANTCCIGCFCLCFHVWLHMFQ